jgi:hypothetical protein
LVDTSIVYLGKRYVVRFMRYEGSYPAQDYVLSATGPIRARFLALGRRLGDDGRLPDRSHGHFLEPPYEEIYELKPLSGRVFGFFYKRNLYLTNGAPKKRPKAQESDYKLALRLRKDFFDNLGKHKNRGRKNGEAGRK